MKILLMLLICFAPVLRINSQTNDTVHVNSIPSDTLTADTTNAAADSLKLAKARPLIPLFPDPLSLYDQQVQIITRREILYNTYSYTGDIIEEFPLAFQRRLGVAGQPDELLIYGNGFNNITYLLDGRLLNHRYTNSLDLNNVQSEAIDSMEILPSPRAFLYGNINNGAAVNIIPREDYSIDKHQGPFSRIRYYQAPNEEAMIDASYRTYLARRITGIFEMTNYSSADRFPNSAYGSWKFRTALSYLFSDYFNIKAGYNYNRTETRLFGGLKTLNDSLNIIPQLSEKTASVINPRRYQKYHEHEFNITLRNKGYGPFTGKIDLYYIASLTERRDNEKANPDSLPVVFTNDRYKVFGALLDQRFRMSILDLQVYGNAERIDFNQPYFGNKMSINSVSLSGRAVLDLMDSTLKPSAFAKYLSYNGKSFYGIGSDLLYSLNEQLNFYAGLSHFTKPFNPDLLNKTNVSSIEIGAGYNSDNINFDVKLYNQHFKDDMLLLGSIDGLGLTKTNRTVSGIGLDLMFHVWKIYLESHSAYYKTKLSINDIHFLPDLTSLTKLYYRDTLFNSNLFLKTGIQAHYIGKQDYYNYDMFSQSTVYFMQPLWFSAQDLSSSYTLDFFLIGEIRRRAIIYFTFENLTDKEEYIAPGYRLPRRGLRLGVSWEFLN